MDVVQALAPLLREFGAAAPRSLLQVPVVDIEVIGWGSVLTLS